MPGKVYAVAMSAMATTHMLVASGTEDVRVRLCDLASGAFTHTLSGHRDGVWAVQWSAASEWVLISGGCDGAIRFWDIRQAGCFQVLDQNRSQLGRRPPIVKSVPGVQEQAAASVSASSRGESLRVHRQGEQQHSRLNTTPPIRRKFRAKDFEAQRQHPGMVSTLDKATAHYGSVTALQATDDGLYLFSAGTDSRVRLWDMQSGCNTLVNYEATRIRTHQGTQLAVSSDSSLLFVASAHSIQAYDVWTGHLHSKLSGHYDTVNCCAFHANDQELYSGSSDRQILVWAPPTHTPLEDLDEKTKQGGALFVKDEDAWSD